MGKFNVCLLNDSFPPLIDGVGNAVVNYANIIQREYGKATVAVPKYPDVEDRYPFEVYRYPSIDSTKLVGYRAGYPFAPSTLSAMEKHGFDIIHSHCPLVSTMLARSIRERAKAPLIFTYHAKFDIDIANVLDSEILQKAAIRIMVNNISACDEVWVVSNGAGENLRSLGYKGDYRVMTNGVDFPCARASAEAVAEIRQSVGLQEDEPMLLFVGRMMWYKGLRLLLDSLRRMLEKGKRFRMVFVGDGNDRQEVEAYAERLGLKERCVFVGAVHDREKLRAYFTAAQLFVFLSQFDTNGLVVREAAACGLGSLLIEGSCAAEGIVHGETGLLTAESVPAVEKQITYAVEHPEEMRALGQRAMDQIYVSWDTAVKNAVERYGVLREQYLSGELQRNRINGDGLYTTMADIADDVERIRNYFSEITQKMNDFRNSHWD